MTKIIICEKCQGKRAYFSEYDRFACIACDIWLEPDHCEGRVCDAGFKHASGPPSTCGENFEFFEDMFPEVEDVDYVSVITDEENSA